jgi:hypothetical protein
MMAATLTIIGTGIYLIGFLVAARLAYVWLDEEEPDAGDGWNMFYGAFIALFWPLMLVVLLLAEAWIRSIGRETPRQRRVRLAQEAETARIEAGKHGLPWPSDKGLAE